MLVMPHAKPLRYKHPYEHTPFTMRVLEIEQGMLEAQAHKARIIISKQGEFLSFDQYRALMGESSN